MLSIIFTIILEKYPSSSFSLAFLAAFQVKSFIIVSQKLWISSFLFSIILLFLHSQYFSGTSEIRISRPSTTTSILLEAKLDHGMLMRKHPSLLQRSLKGRLSFLMISFFRATFLITTQPDHNPILRFSELKPSTYYPRILLRILSTMV